MDVFTSTASGANNQDARCIRCDLGLFDNERRHYFSLYMFGSFLLSPGVDSLTRVQGARSWAIGNSAVAHGFHSLDQTACGTVS